MRQSQWRLLFGGGLILLGGLMLLERFGILGGAAGIFWGIALLLGAGYFLYEFIRSPGPRWWAVIPGMALLGMGGAALLPRVFSGAGGGIFLGALGLAFIIIYLTDRSRWWGLIPGGVLVTLGLIAGLENTGLAHNGSLLFLGLGATFLMVAILPTPAGRMDWAYIPAVILVLMGVLLGMQATAGLAGFVLPAALILLGLVFIVRFLINRPA